MSPPVEPQRGDEVVGPCGLRKGSLLVFRMNSFGRFLKKAGVAADAGGEMIAEPRPTG